MSMGNLTRDILKLKVGESFVTYRKRADAYGSASYIRKCWSPVEIIVSEGWLIFQDGTTERVCKVTRISEQTARARANVRHPRQ